MKQFLHIFLTAYLMPAIYNYFVIRRDTIKENSEITMKEVYAVIIPWYNLYIFCMILLTDFVQYESKTKKIPFPNRFFRLPPKK